MLTGLVFLNTIIPIQLANKKEKSNDLAFKTATNYSNKHR